MLELQYQTTDTLYAKPQQLSVQKQDILIDEMPFRTKRYLILWKQHYLVGVAVDQDRSEMGAARMDVDGLPRHPQMEKKNAPPPNEFLNANRSGEHHPLVSPHEPMQ